jgi:hypothetical protein
MNENNPEVPVLISLIPKLIRGGHIIPYHIAVNKAANLIGWKHIAILPSHEDIVDFPGNWYPVLSSIDLEAKAGKYPIEKLLRLNDIWKIERIFRFNGIWKLAITITDFLKQEILPYTNHPIIFVENFIHTQLLAIFIALCIVPRKNLTVWLLYRQETHKTKTRLIYKLLNTLIKRIVAPGKFRLLTDSELLSKSLGNYFKTEFTVMPIPHTDIINIKSIREKSDEIICWWPGQPRDEKGWQKIKSLAGVNSESAKQIYLVATQNSELKGNMKGVKVKQTANFVEKTEYLQLLENSDIILLPYDVSAYGERTSGIFTECITAGKIPVVTQGTWMAKELIKYGLDELIIEWNEPELIIQQVIYLAKSEILKIKIQKMQSVYQNFHSIETYSYYMNKLLKN